MRNVCLSSCLHFMQILTLCSPVQLTTLEDRRSSMQSAWTTPTLPPSIEPLNYTRSLMEVYQQDGVSPCREKCGSRRTEDGLRRRIRSSRELERRGVFVAIGIRQFRCTLRLGPFGNHANRLNFARFRSKFHSLP